MITHSLFLSLLLQFLFVLIAQNGGAVVIRVYQTTVTGLGLNSMPEGPCLICVIKVILSLDLLPSFAS